MLIINMCCEDVTEFYGCYMCFGYRYVAGVTGYGLRVGLVRRLILTIIDFYGKKCSIPKGEIC